MYISLRERLAAAFGTMLALGLLGAALLLGLMTKVRPIEQSSIALLDIQPPSQRRAPVHKPKVRDKAGSAPPGVVRQHTPPPPPAPVVVPAVAPPLIAVPKPGPATAASNVAADRYGAGGGGGTGSGTGAGGAGDGEGGDDIPPRLIRGRLKFSDLPQPLREARAFGTVSVRYGVETDGRVRECSVSRSSGIAELDRLTCALIEQRFRFEPSRDDAGRPVRSIIVENHSWVLDREDRDS